MNPCPCGYAGTEDGRCRCSPALVERYAARVSGPLRDRIDLWTSLPRVPGAALVGGSELENTAVVAARIAEARQRQLARPGMRLNGRLAGRALRSACRIDPPTMRRVVQLSELERLSGRGTERLLRVARTIADLDGVDAVRVGHLDEAARFRLPQVRDIHALAG